MLKNVLCIVPTESSPFALYRYFFEGLIESLVRLGIICRVVEGDGSNIINLYREVVLDPPDCTFCFNGFVPEENEPLFCDEMQVAHVAFLLDPPTRFLSLLGSKYTIACCIDRSFCEYFRKQGMEQVLFLPHAVHHDLHVEPERLRKYEIVAMAICYDFEGERKAWRDKYPKEIWKMMEETINITFSEPYTSFLEALMRVVVDPRKIDLKEICYDLETYIKGYDRVKLIESVQQEHTVHIFGSSQKGVGWDRYFPAGKSNVILHPGVSIQEAVEVMKEAKIVLNSCATVKDGSHERIFLGLACGAMVCTSENLFIREQFSEGNGIIYYSFSKRESVNREIVGYLRDESARCEAVKRGYAIVRKNHTWDARVKALQELF